MNLKKITLIVVALLIAFTAISIQWAPASAAAKSISKSISFGKPADIYLGNAGVYFANSNYTATAELTRERLNPTKSLRFTQRSVEIHLYDNKNKEIKNLFGYVYVYFNLNAEDRANWNKEKLSIYQFDTATKKWVECRTWLVSDKSSPYGRATCLISSFGTYALGTKR
ncbi:MAG: hypothetical protein PVG32_16365 [Anaerolineales bacterium]